MGPPRRFGVIGTCLASPGSKNPRLFALAIYGVFPAMAVSGLWRWRERRIGRFFQALIARLAPGGAIPADEADLKKMGPR